MRPRSNRWLLLLVSLAACGILIALSLSGTLAPVRALLAAPLEAVSGAFYNLALGITGGITDFAELQRLRQRNAELETALAQFQAELVTLREIASDYQRLADLLNYTSSVQDQDFLAADVINNADPNAPLQTIVINRGTRDGVAVGMPVITRQGLVGRILDVTADASRVLLITDQNSSISARLQTSRALGSVRGLLAGTLRMEFIPIGDVVQEGDLVLTSGLGGGFPADIVIGQVTSVRSFEFDLYQTTEVRSLVNFDTLEIVLVITSFRPVNMSVFLDDDGG